jgi:hypothetical protein
LGDGITLVLELVLFSFILAGVLTADENSMLIGLSLFMFKFSNCAPLQGVVLAEILITLIADPRSLFSVKIILS